VNQHQTHTLKSSDSSNDANVVDVANVTKAIININNAARRPATHDCATHMKQQIQTTLNRYLGGRTGVGVNAVSRYAILRPIAMSLIVTTLTMAMAPGVQAMQAKSQQDAQFTGSPAARYSELIRDLKEVQINPRFVPAGASSPFTSAAPRGVLGKASASLNNALKSLGLGRGDFTDLIDQLNNEHETLQRDAASLQSKWRAANVAPRLIAEQIQLDQTVAAKHAELIQKLKAASASTAATDAAQIALTEFLKKEVAEPSYNKLNLKNLPWQSAYAEPGKLRAPMTDSAAFKRYLSDRERTQQTALQTRVQKKGVALAASLAPNAAATSDGTKNQQKALPISTAPSAADLAPTPDAPHTAAIRALAVTELGKNPVAIYNWVHDNIAYVPTYGSIQGAEDTLNKKSGNAFDQASLTVAMLRSAGIHARYVVGTVEVPEYKLRNWMGGFKTIDAAQQILGQGGIPNVALVKGGRIVSVRMEHAWVEAYVSMFPSRGAKHVGGVTPGDHWIPIDPSYKQHTFKAGMNLKDTVGFDAQSFVDAAKQGATVDEAEGWVQNLNQTNVKTRLDQYQQSIKQTIDNSVPNGAGTATVGDVLGTQTITPDKNPFLVGVLKNPVIAVGERYSSLPNSLRAQFRYGLYADQFSYTLDSPDFQYQVPTSEIAGKKLTIAWVPASDAAKAAIEALLPKPNADGSPIRPEQLPQGLPGSISLKAELRIEGQTVATSAAYKAGAEPKGAGAFTPYTSIAGAAGSGAGNAGSEWDETADGLVAGQQTALGVSIQGISKAQLDTLKTRMEQTKGKLEQVQANPNNTTPINGLTGDKITGDILTANIWGWFADLQSHGRIASSQATMTTRNGEDNDGTRNNQFTTSGLYDAPGLQYGLFHANAQPNKLFNAVTTGIAFKGVLIDIGHTRHNRWVKDSGLDANSGINANDPTEVQRAVTRATEDTKKRWVGYNKMRGQYASALEHAIPEQFFNDTTKCNSPNASSSTTPPLGASKPACAEGVSAVKAIAIAQSQGQKIFVINQTNADVAIPLLSHRSSVIDEIRSSVAAGKEVTIHESNITANGWRGAGYSVVDPQNGSGGFLIEGGANGGIMGLATIASGTLLLAVVGVFGLYVSVALAIALVLLTAILGIMAIVEGSIPTQYKDEAQFIGIAGLLLSTALAFTLAPVVAIVGAAVIPVVLAVIFGLLVLQGIFTFAKYAWIPKPEFSLEVETV
jgi:transglutaminase-like putative cysteine protease